MIVVVWNSWLWRSVSAAYLPQPYVTSVSNTSCMWDWPMISFHGRVCTSVCLFQNDALLCGLIQQWRIEIPISDNSFNPRRVNKSESSEGRLSGRNVGNRESPSLKPRLGQHDFVVIHILLRTTKHLSGIIYFHQNERPKLEILQKNANRMLFCQMTNKCNSPSQTFWQEKQA